LANGSLAERTTVTAAPYEQGEMTVSLDCVSGDESGFVSVCAHYGGRG